MNKIYLGSLQIPTQAATKTFAILAKRGAGKSYTAAVLAEEFYKNSVPFVVFDPIDVWWGLRFNKDGKSKGLPVVVFGLEHADITLDRDMGKSIAQAIAKENVSVVISTFGMPKAAQRHLITEFSEEILRINNNPRHIFIEEAHEFVPQRIFGGEGKVFNAVSNLVVMGRNRGLGVTLINQRAATINKDVLTQIDTLLAFRNVAPQDRQALRVWVEYHAAEGDFEEFMKSLPSLPTGEGWIWSPEFLETFERIKIRERETFHPDREKLDSTFVMPQLEQGDVQFFISKFLDNKGVMEEPPKQITKKEEFSTQRVRELEEENQALTEQHEQEIEAKDKLISQLQTRNQQLEGIINAAKKIFEGQEFNQVVQVNNSSNVDMWIKKLGKGGASRILKFLAEKSPMKFTRSQIGLAVGLSSKSGSFRTFMATLKRNMLIVEEGGFSRINPDL
jgi:uncharacterized protein